MIYIWRGVVWPGRRRDSGDASRNLWLDRVVPSAQNEYKYRHTVRHRCSTIGTYHQLGIRSRILGRRCSFPTHKSTGTDNIVRREIIRIIIRPVLKTERTISVSFPLYISPESSTTFIYTYRCLFYNTNRYVIIDNNSRNRAKVNYIYIYTHARAIYYYRTLCPDHYKQQSRLRNTRTYCNYRL